MKTINNTSQRHRSVSSALWLPLLTCAAMLAGCTNDDTPHAGDNRRTPVTFSTSIQTALPQAAAHAAPGTRTATDANGNTVWTQGDAVSISMLTAGGTLTDDVLPDCANVPYNVDPATGALTPASGTPMYYPLSPQDAKVDFIAWHTAATTAAAATTGEDYLLTLSTVDQATADKQLALDPLYSNNAKGITPGTAPVPLQFRHLMSKVKFDLTLGVGLTGGTVTDVRLEGMIETASFDLRDGSVKNQPASVNPISALKSDAASAGADATYTALLIPQSANTNTTPRTIVVTVNGVEYSGPILNEDVFTANAMCIYPVTVHESGVEVGIPTKDVPWTEGELPTVTIDGKTFRMIRNADDLKRFADDVNGGKRALNAIQTADIDLKGIDNWVPINWGNNSSSAPFTGIYNGNGYTISNLTISSMTKGLYSGLFGKIGDGALLTGIHLRDVEITGEAGWYVGALAGWVDEDATVTLCSAKGEINVREKGELHTGGLVGFNFGAITRCWTDVTVTTDATLVGQISAHAGGIAGSNYYGGLLFACHATGNVTLKGRLESTPDGNALFAGGITGYNSGSLSSFANIYCCIAEGNVSATAETEVIEVYAGGLAGFHRNGIIRSNYARGNAVAEGTNVSNMAGAIVEYNYGGKNSVIEYCYGTGAGGKGTSNLNASNTIVYNENPAAGDIYKIIAGSNGGEITANDVPFTIYNPAATPAYGISIVKNNVNAKDFWQENDGTYPSLNFLNNN